MITVADDERAELDFSLREMKRGWRIHAAIYAVVITGLTVLNLVLVAQTDADFLWFFFPLVGWGDWPDHGLPRGDAVGRSGHRTAPGVD